MKTLINSLSDLIRIARILGVNERDLKNAADFLRHHEFGLCFDIIVTQMFEYDIEIDKETHEFISKIAQLMELNPEDYAYLKNLIKPHSSISKSAKDELIRIIKS